MKGKYQIKCIFGKKWYYGVFNGCILKKVALIFRGILRGMFFINSLKTPIVNSLIIPSCPP